MKKILETKKELEGGSQQAHTRKVEIVSFSFIFASFRFTISGVNTEFIELCFDSLFFTIFNGND